MTKFTHTEGPWIAHKYPTKDGYAYAIQHKQHRGISIANLSPGVTSDRIEPICEANARLIAEAPAMLEALREAEKLTRHSRSEADRCVHLRVSAILARIDGGPQ